MRIGRIPISAGSEHVVEFDLGVEWESNDDQHVLAASLESGQAVLVLNPHSNDPDSSKIVLVFDGYQSLSAGVPNDEARDMHRLYRSGLRSILWAGEVIGSQAVQQIDTTVAVPSDLRHFVVLLKEETIEVVAKALSVARQHGSNADLAVAAVSTRLTD